MMARFGHHSDGDASRLSPPGYMSKAEAAKRLGISTKTLDRRIKTEPILSGILRKGRQVFLRAESVEAFFELCEERGQI